MPLSFRSGASPLRCGGADRLRMAKYGDALSQRPAGRHCWQGAGDDTLPHVRLPQGDLPRTTDWEKERTVV